MKPKLKSKIILIGICSLALLGMAVFGGYQGGKNNNNIKKGVDVHLIDINSRPADVKVLEKENKRLRKEIKNLQAKYDKLQKEYKK
jgi:hypothetical protein